LFTRLPLSVSAKRQWRYIIVAWGIAPGVQFAQKEALKVRFMPRLIFKPKYNAHQNDTMIEPASRVNRAFSAGTLGFNESWTLPQARNDRCSPSR